MGPKLQRLRTMPVDFYPGHSADPGCGMNRTWNLSSSFLRCMSWLWQFETSRSDGRTGVLGGRTEIYIQRAQVGLIGAVDLRVNGLDLLSKLLTCPYTPDLSRLETFRQ